MTTEVGVGSQAAGSTASTDLLKPRTPRLYFASAPRGVEDLLARELEELGATRVKAEVAGVAFEGDLEVGYRACLWSRVASRILMPLAEFPSGDADALYRGVQNVDWTRHLAADGTLAVTARLRDSAFDNSHFVALRTKDAVVDQFRKRLGRRPDVDLDEPDLRVYVFADRDRATVGIDLSGEPLHRRGYRVRGVAAPLKENLAAAILLRAGWPRLAADGWALYDPMCGSGTLLLEGAAMAAGVAPGRGRERFGCERWKGHQADLWRRLRSEAEGAPTAFDRLVPIGGGDQDPSAVEAARANLERAGLVEHVSLRAEGLSLASPTAPNGLLVTNPPWGQRLGAADLDGLYQRLGDRLREAFSGWNAAVLGPDEQQLREVGLRWFKINRLYHGPVSCRLAHYRIGTPPRATRDRSVP